MKEVLEKIQELLRSLVDRLEVETCSELVTENLVSNSVFCFKTRMQKDGRQPQTLRLTIRRYTATNKWFNRESRQAPIPNHTAQKIASGQICQTKIPIKSVLTSFKGLLGIK